MRTIARLYDSYADATAVVNELETSGSDHSNISLVANADAHGRHTAGSVTGGGTSAVDPADPDDSDSGAGTKRGAVAGTLVGGGAGLLAGIGALAIPGIGPLVASVAGLLPQRLKVIGTAFSRTIDPIKRHDFEAAVEMPDECPEFCL